MKKYTGLIFLLLGCLAMAACGSAQSAVETEPVSVEATAAETTQPVITEVEITMENWQDYFEQREAEWVQVNDRGDVILRDFGYGVFLKEEYVGRLAQEEPVAVTFEMKANSVRYQVMGDLTTDNYIIKDEVLHNEGEQIITADVQDLRNGKIEEGSDFHNAVAAYLTVDGEFAG